MLVFDPPSIAAIIMIMVGVVAVVGAAVYWLRKTHSSKEEKLARAKFQSNYIETFLVTKTVNSLR